MSSKRWFSNVSLDTPTKQDYIFPDAEVWNWEVLLWPKESIIIQDQWKLPACWGFSWTHVVNWNNINEDSIFGWARKQLLWVDLRNKFCNYRWYSNQWTSIQTFANWLKKEGLIEWYVTIARSTLKDEQIKKIKAALSMWHFISCWSDNWDRWKIWKTKTYSIRTDWKVVWHLRPIVMDLWDSFLCPNSRWAGRWDKWYFKLPYNLVDKVYSKLVIIDKDDRWILIKSKEKSQAMEAVRQLKKTYSLSLIWDEERKYCSNIADKLREMYWFTDKDL